ncbi:hypothetical protein ACXR8V_17045 [Pseudomonas aeruginosa]|uniref:hypothetical protein n=1 Tax=Pseudomonas aeruginosa TaxID=287 RepID=UPI001143039D|nr:hypothetical protein [Pseudomonas aeruginosa]HEM6834824.1 hypothetical protein [Citrobacter koseri]EME5145231.1 hypothetical protein [Pseudomonas aeruginosa]MBG7110425.1 hypothetical protein [Pseudomonas aeruginosa]MBI7397111.1 hypothetical protein [Pseudomonas aeruginosa]MBI7437784.1 hypothetical protein [Pseudomonas aeruginosa]
MKFSFLIPEEIKNATLANKDLTSVSEISAGHRAFLLFNSIVMASGASVGFWLGALIDEGILETVITFSGVIIGFVITAMLFSGRSAFAIGLNLQQVKVYRIKTKYMLLSQANTLFSFLFCLGFCIATLFALKLKAESSSLILSSVSFSFLFLGGYRTLLLPYQIYEVHSFSLDNLVDEIADSERGQLRSDGEARLRALEAGRPE